MIDGPLTILSPDGLTRDGLTVPSSENDLADRLIEAWVPYFECHKCGRFDYCKHVRRLEANPRLAEDIRCGIVSTALRNYIGHTYKIFEEANAPGKQTYLDAAFHFTRFVQAAELTLGTFLDPALLTWWPEEWRPAVFSSVVMLRSSLNDLAEAMALLPSFKSMEHCLLVQGESEKAFLEALGSGATGTIAQFSGLNILSYGGDGNISSKRAQLLIEDQTRRGYRVYIQADRDGRAEDVFRDIRERLRLRESQLFAFSFDFETALPPRLLYATLSGLKLVDEGVAAAEFVEERRRQTGAVWSWLEGKLGGGALSSLKPQIARTAGELLRRTAGRWWYDEKFHRTEIGQFLAFAQRAKFLTDVRPQAD